MTDRSPLRQALVAFRGGRLSAEELASYAESERAAYLSDPANRYRFRDDARLEALGILSALPDSPDPVEDAAHGLLLLDGDIAYTASRLLLVDPEALAVVPCGDLAQLVAQAGGMIDAGEPWRDVLGHVAEPLEAATEGLEGDDYPELLVLEAGAIAQDLRLAVDGAVEVLGPGRPRIDAGLLAERFAAVGQVLRGERPFRAFVRIAGGAARVVLSY